LEVYNSGEKDKLKAMNTLNLAHIIRASEGDDNKYAGDDIIFEEDTLSEHKRELESADVGVDEGVDTGGDFIDIEEI
jgi:hypothetical protein